MFLLHVLRVCSADLDKRWCGHFSDHVKFCSFMFMHKISTRMVCVNGKHPPVFVLEEAYVFVKENIL